ncbi:MAG: protein kinase, partial [Clostridia bacterium]
MMKGMIFAERYKLEDFIGQGGMSLVYRALDIRTGHSVAVKILKSEYNSDKEFLERFQREAQAASLMSHNNIVNLLDVGVEGDYRYLVLEYVSGNTLKDIIRQRGRLNSNTTVQITIRVLSALQHAHDNGIIHRDIKPQNVLVHSDGHVKVADFGIARMTNAFTISKGDTVVGSVHYSS